MRGRAGAGAACLCADRSAPFPHTGTYYASLQTALVELINKDYADFLSLASNLVRGH